MMHIPIQKLLQHTADLLFPPVCPVCEEILSRRSGNVPDPFVCPACYAQLSFPREPRCLLCSRPLEDEQEALCFDCRSRKEPVYFDRAVSVMMHDEYSRKILYDLKYHNRRDNAKMLACEAAHREGKRIRSWQPDVMIPVPLHKKRALKRGFNQAELLARQFSVHVPVPVDAGYLVRIRRTSAQKELPGAARRRNVKDAFAIDWREPARKYEGKRVLLVDDIYTSGATLSECAKVLKEAGAKRVFALTFGLG